MRFCDTQMDGALRRLLKNQSKNNYHCTLFEFQEFGGWKTFFGGGGVD